MTALSSQGYFVLFPNPRGSYGAGEVFTQGNVKDFGYGDLRDINAGVDEAIAQLPIDPNRIGIAGWSYGGYMTMWAVTQTPPLPCGRRRRGHRRLAKLLWRKPHRPVDDPVFRRVRLRRSRRLCAQFAHHVYQKRQDPDAHRWSATAMPSVPPRSRTSSGTP